MNIKIKKGEICIYPLDRRKKIERRDIYFIKYHLSRQQAEKVFNVALQGREFTVEDDLTDINSITISFHDRNNIFGWTERLTKQEFYKKLYE